MITPVENNHIFTRTAARAVAYTVLLSATLAACDKSDAGTVTIRGDSPGFDSLSSRGDSLVAQAGRVPSRVDTIAAKLQANSARASAPAGARVVFAPQLPLGPGDNPMTRRAQARGDSMARAAGLRIAAANDPNSRVVGDTARGVVTQIGSNAARQFVLRTSSGTSIAMSGMITASLSSLLGAEIVIHGMKVAPRDIVVRDYVVRAYSGIPVVDGRVENVKGTWSLRLTEGTGRKALGTPSPALQSLVGARVWYLTPTAPVPAGIARFGLIGRR